MRLFYALILFYIFSSQIFASSADTIALQKKVKYDTNYIISYRDWLHITFVGINQQTGISLKEAINGKDLVFATNNPFSYGVGIDYEWFTFEFSKSFKKFEYTDKRKGQTQSSTIRLGYTGRKIRLSSYYSNSKGYYLKNIEDYLPDWDHDKIDYPRFDDLKNKTIVLSLYYTFLHKTYSNMAAMWQLDRQIKSSGSPVIGLLTLWEGISATSPFHFSDTLNLVDDFLNIKKIDYKRIGLLAGYMHTISIMKHFYIHAALTQGLFYSYGTIDNFNNIKTNKNALGLSIYYRLSLGYNGDRFYAGILYLKDSFVSDITESTILVSSYDYLRLLAGYRFPIKKRKWMKKIYL